MPASCLQGGGLAVPKAARPWNQTDLSLYPAFIIYQRFVTVLCLRFRFERHNELVEGKCPSTCGEQCETGSETRSVVSDSWRPHGLLPCIPMEFSPWNSPGQNTGVGSRPLLQGFFPTQGSNPGLLHCRQVLYQLSYQGSPGGREWGLIKWFLVRFPHLLNPHLVETLAGVGDAVMRKPNPVSAPTESSAGSR